MSNYCGSHFAVMSLTSDPRSCTALSPGYKRRHSPLLLGAEPSYGSSPILVGARRLCRCQELLGSNSALRGWSERVAGAPAEARRQAKCPEFFRRNSASEILAVRRGADRTLPWKKGERHQCGGTPLACSLNIYLIYFIFLQAQACTPMN